MEADKVQKIREEVERLKGWNNNVRNSTRHMTLQEEDFNRGKHSSYLEILNFIDSLQEEPVSEDLEEAVNAYIGYAPEVDECSSVYGKRKAFKAGANWQRSQLMRNAFETAIVDDWQYGKDADHTAIPAIHQRIEGHKIGDKVKIVVIPERLNNGTE